MTPAKDQQIAAREVLTPAPADRGALLDEHQAATVSAAYTAATSEQRPTVLLHRCPDDFYDWFELGANGQIWLSRGDHAWHMGTATIHEDGTAGDIVWTNRCRDEPPFRRERWASWTYPGGTRTSTS